MSGGAAALRAAAPGRAGAEEGAWYLAQLKPQGFGRAVVNLERQGFSAFMPLCARMRRRGGRYRRTTEPVFPGYLFVRIDPARPDWRAVNSTYGVARLVALERGRPTPVPGALMAGLLARCDAEGLLSAPPEFAVGDEVRVVAGPFAEQMGRIEALSGPERVQVLLEMMGRAVRTSLGRGDLEPVGGTGRRRPGAGVGSG